MRSVIEVVLWNITVNHFWISVYVYACLCILEEKYFKYIQLVIIKGMLSEKKQMSLFLPCTSCFQFTCLINMIQSNGLKIKM